MLSANFGHLLIVLSFSLFAIQKVEMAFIGVRHIGSGSYYYLVENKRESKMVRQKMVKYLGKTPPSEEEIKAIIERQPPNVKN